MIEPRASKVPSSRRRTSLNSAVAIFLATCVISTVAGQEVISPGEPTKLTRVRYSYPSLSSDGAMFVLEASVSGNWEIYTLRREGMGDGGEGLVQLTSNRDLDRMASWSPDGRHIAFISDRSGNFDVYRMNADGTHVVQITDTPEAEIHPYWSPDSRSIIYNRRVANQRLYAIWITDAAGSRHQELLRDDQLNSYARISPDGQWIVFDKWWNNDETNGEIMIMKRDGSELKRLTENDVYDGYPAWFPDSRRILYSSEVDGVFKLFWISIEGGEATQITFGAGGDQRAGVSSDGQTIYFNRNLDGTIELYEMPVPEELRSVSQE